MADLAFTPGLPTEDVQLAQVPPPVQAPVPVPVPTPAPAPPVPMQAPVPLGRSETSRWGLEPERPGALSPTVPPTMAGPTAPAKPTWADADDEREAREAVQNERNVFDARDRVLSHLNNWEPIATEMRTDDLDRYNELVTNVWPKLTKQEQAARRPALRALEGKIKDQQRAIAQRLKDQAVQADAKYENPEQRERTASVLAGHVEAVAKETEQLAATRNPETRRVNDFAMKTSPLATMSRKSADGKRTTYEPLRDAATAIALLNGISNEQAVLYALAIGSPVGFDDKTGDPLPGLNGRKGAGATNYRPAGTDIRKNRVIELPGEKKLRVPVDVMKQFEAARLKGWKAAKQWKAEQEEAAKPGWVGRQLEGIIPKKGF